MILGAILAGGQSRRFGSDKALAPFKGQALIAHVAARLAPQVDALAVCGRGPFDELADRAIAVWLADRPTPGLGPLGGLLAALEHGAAKGFCAVLSTPCDTPLLPLDLAARLGPGPSYAATADRAHPATGLWPVSLAPALRAHVAGGGRKAADWARWAGARAIAFEDAGAFANVNDPLSLKALED